MASSSTIIRTEGSSALFAGITPRVAKIAPACGIMISCFEVCTRHTPLTAPCLHLYFFRVLVNSSESPNSLATLPSLLTALVTIDYAYIPTHHCNITYILYLTSAVVPSQKIRKMMIPNHDNLPSCLLAACSLPPTLSTSFDRSSSISICKAISLPIASPSCLCRCSIVVSCES